MKLKDNSFKTQHFPLLSSLNLQSSLQKGSISEVRIPNFCNSLSPQEHKKDGA